MQRRQTTTVVFTIALLCALGAGTAWADDEVDRFMRRFDNEPKIREVQIAAINYYNVSPERISSLRSRTRSKALVPGISIGVTNSLSSFHLAVDDIIFRNRDIARFEDQNADFLEFTAAASWGLDRLVFNAEELDVMSLIGIQDGIQREVTALYYTRRRLQIELELNPPTSLEARLSGRLRLEELTGLLDAYTGGFFSREIEKRTRRRGR
jgi:hypothetical protein